MRRILSLLAGAVAGVLLAGIVAGMAIPTLPSSWRSERLIWTMAIVVVAASIGVATVLSKPRRE